MFRNEGASLKNNGKVSTRTFSTAVSIAVLMQSVLCKPYIFTKQPTIARQCTPQQRPLVQGGSTRQYRWRVRLQDWLHGQR